MSSKIHYDLFSKHFNSAQSIYPLNAYKYKQIQNLVVDDQEKVFPPGWIPTGFYSQDQVTQIMNSLVHYEVEFTYDDWYSYGIINVFDGPHIFEWVNSEAGHNHFNLPKLPENYFYHILLINTQFIKYTGTLTQLPFYWNCSYYISDDSYVLFKRTNTALNTYDSAVCNCFPVNNDHMVYSNYDVSTGQCVATYSNLNGGLKGNLSPDQFYLLDFGPNDVNDPNGRAIVVNINSQSQDTFSGTPDQLYFRMLLIPEIKV